MNTQTTAERVTLSLPPQTRQRLDAFAAAERRSRSNAAAVLLDAVLRRTTTIPPTAPAGATGT